MNRTSDKKLAAAQAAQAATEKALLLAEAAAKRAQTAKVESKLAKKTWKLARKAAKRTAKEARRLQKKLAKVAGLLKKVNPKAKQRPAVKTVRSKVQRTTRKPAMPRVAPKLAIHEPAMTPTAPPETAN